MTLGELVDEYHQRRREADVDALEGQEELARVVAIGECARGEAEDEVREARQEADQSERRGGTAEQEHDIAEGRPLDPVPDQRKEDAGRIAPEVPMAKSPERAPAAANPRP